MTELKERNAKIIDALIRKAERVCPGSLALVGIYGSFQTGDYYDKSDLDLMIVINDEPGLQLCSTFIQEDLQVGHDIYCTTWESLEKDAAYVHPNISKLMDSRIVYCADDAYRKRLVMLRSKADTILHSPLTKEDFRKAQRHLWEAEHFYARAMVSDDMPDILLQSARVLYGLQNAIAMLNKAYYRYGTKRFFEEIEAMALKPDNYRKQVNAIIGADSPEEVKQHLTALLTETIQTFRLVEQSLSPEKRPATADVLRGTYEEMFSNWRNKIHAAAAANDRHLAFSSLAAMQEMLCDIAADTEIGEYNMMNCYDPADLFKTAQACDTELKRYLDEYRKANLQPRLYRNIDAFIEEYLKE